MSQAPESIEAALRDRLMRDSALSELIGQRVFPLIVPTDADYPAITYQRTGTDSEQSMVGASGIQVPRIDLKCWSADYDEAKAIAKKLRTCLNGFRSPKEGIVVGGTTFHFRQIQMPAPGENDTIEQSPQSGHVFFGVVIPIQISHTETVTTYVHGN